MKKESKCLNCDAKIVYNTNHQKGKYCNNKCQQKYVKKDYISKWLSGEISGGKSYNLSNYIRGYLLEQSNMCCSLCGWSKVNPHTGKVPLEIDHVDDNPFNHSPENLQVLCPNCHALKTKSPKSSPGGRYQNGSHPKYTAQRASK
jgi:HNH endonuclease